MVTSEYRFTVIFSIFVVSHTMLRFFSEGAIPVEKTLAIIKPDGVYGNYTDMIKKVIHDNDFRIVRERWVQLDEDTVRTFYAEHYSKAFFTNLVEYMTRSSILAILLGY